MENTSGEQPGQSFHPESEFDLESIPATNQTVSEAAKELQDVIDIDLIDPDQLVERVYELDRDPDGFTEIVFSNGMYPEPEVSLSEREDLGTVILNVFSDNHFVQWIYEFTKDQEGRVVLTKHIFVIEHDEATDLRDSEVVAREQWEKEEEIGSAMADERELGLAGVSEPEAQALVRRMLGRGRLLRSVDSA
jgi:hypothetical protein